MAKIFKHRSEVAYFDYKDFKTLAEQATLMFMVRLSPGRRQWS